MLHGAFALDVEPPPPNGVEKIGESAWAALCAAHASVGQKSKSLILEWLYDTARTDFIRNS
jgi:hypothetical protein